MEDQLYTQEQIVHHVENASPTKFMWSFSKSPRFPKEDRRGKSDNIYDFPSFGKTRKSGMGYGTKTDFTKRALVTELAGEKRDYDPGTKPRGFQYSFGLARDKFEKAYCPGYKNIDMNVPGPGKYNYLKTTGSESPSYTLHAICGERGWTNRHMQNPGPGAYAPVVKINDKGRYPISRISNVKSFNFGLDHVDRFKSYKSNGVPGPNAYKCSPLTGSVNFNSKFRTPRFCSMGVRFKTLNSRDDYPGPGSYYRFSEFGILCPNKKNKKDKEAEKNNGEGEGNNNNNEERNEEQTADQGNEKPRSNQRFEDATPDNNDETKAEKKDKKADVIES